jgi:hypothetical protein
MMVHAEVLLEADEVVEEVTLGLVDGLKYG